jgi:flagellar hook protein FlgE
MIRSLYSGISSLRNHQLKMDVTSHNIANVNTTGYKAQRVTFKEGFSQILKGATRPPGNSGGTNPMQAGLGMAVGSIDSLMHQGSMQSTGQITDLAVEGRAFFAFSSGEGTFYSRNGALQMDANGNLVSPNNGYTLQGLTADADGNIPPTAVADNIRIPYGEKSPAKATSEIGFSCNLDSDSAGVGTTLHTSRYLAAAHETATINGVNKSSDSLTSLYDGIGNDLNIQDNDVLTIVYQTAAGEQEQQLIVGSVTDVANGDADIATLEDLTTALGTQLTSTNGGAGAVTVDVDATGGITIAGTTNATNLTIKNSTRPTSSSYVSNLFLWTDTVTGTSAGRALAPADEDDLLADVYDSHGENLGLEDDGGKADLITVSGSIGGEPIEDDAISPSGGLLYDSTATTMGDLLDYIQQRLRLPDRIPNSAGSEDNTVELNNAATGDDRAPEGSIMIRGQAGLAFALSGIAISATNADTDETSPTPFNSGMINTELQSARDTTVHSTSIEVFDESGAAHTVTTTFTHSGTPNKWLWEITTNGGEQIVGGNRGTVTFAANGSPSSWTFDGGDRAFRFNPMNGAGEMKINLDVGSPDDFTGITQFRSTTTTAAKEQDGFEMGKLSEISISEDGNITGLYTNGTSRTVAKILLAEFNNPAGLMRVGDSMWSESNNSGEGVMYAAGEGTTSKIKPGALEMSNVELAAEFTDLITTQRGYQAASKIITTSDSLLQELVQLVR